jgi:hypothetical protein
MGLEMRRSALWLVAPERAPLARPRLGSGGPPRAGQTFGSRRSNAVTKMAILRQQAPRFGARIYAAVAGVALGITVISGGLFTIWLLLELYMH